MLVRLPSAPEYALAVEKEHRWLPELGDRLPIPIPVPLGLGLPGAGYPFHWSVYGWLPGEAADRATIIDPLGIAEDVARFLEALQRIGATVARSPASTTGFAAPPCAPTTRRFEAPSQNSTITSTSARLLPRGTTLWQPGWTGWTSGSTVTLHPETSCSKGGRLAAVIDFGTCGVGDPSCDFAIAWTLLTRPGRQLLRERLDIEDSTWARGRGWALWKSLRHLANALEDHDEPSEAEARLIVDEILDDYRATR